MPEPGDSDARAKRRRRAASKRVYDANNLMAGNNGELWIGQITIDYMQIGPADGTGLDTNPDLLRTRERIRPLLKNQGLPDRMKYHRSHVPFPWPAITVLRGLRA